MEYRIVHGRIYDPIQGVDGQERDVCIRNGRIVEACQGEIIDAKGCAVFPGGIDPHAHIAGAPLPLARQKGYACVPTPEELGKGYLRMGYTLAVNAAVSGPLSAQTLLEEREIPSLDRLNLILGPQHASAGGGLPERLSGLLQQNGGYGIKSVAPHGGLETAVALADAVESMKLPHPLHLHHWGLGKPNAAAGIRETVEHMQGRRLHLAHLQFYAYGENMESAAEPLIKLLEQNPNLSADAGLVYFGPALATTADVPVTRELAEKLPPTLQYVDGENGFGALPLQYSSKSYAGAMQFLIGLELMLCNSNPWQLTLSTDHPNGAPYLMYPRLLRLLSDEAARRELFQTLPKKALSHSPVPGMMREFTPYEVAVITRAAPARRLGLKHKGHLSPDADGDVAVYPIVNGRPDYAAARYVFKAGRLVVRDNRYLGDAPAHTLVLCSGQSPEQKAFLERMNAMEVSR